MKPFPLSPGDFDLPGIEHLYVNIPFCQRICSFCNFYKNPHRKIAEHFSAVPLSVFYLKELSLWGVENRSFKSIYVGGGSPLELEYPQLLPLLKQLRPDPTAENTIESNPTFSKYEDYYSYFNRISIGIQSFQSRQRQTLGRRHEVDISFLEQISSKIPNVSFDMIYDIAHQKKSDLEQDLRQTLFLSPKHISYYCLEENNALKRPSQALDFSFNSDVIGFQTLIETSLFQQNYEMYELSNFSQKGFDSVHNQAYWEEKDYLGIGPGASGRITLDKKIYRYTQHYNLEKYKETLSRGVIYPLHWEELSPIDILNEYIMLNLRRPWGIDLKSYQERFGHSLLVKKDPLFKRYGEFLRIEDDRLTLSPRGRLLSNRIISDLFFNASDLA